MVGWGFLLAFTGVIVLIAALAQAAKIRSFANCSEAVTGNVAGKYIHHAKNGRHYSLDISYTVDGNDYKRSVSATPSEYDTLAIGSPFALRYKPDNPKKSIRADYLNEQSIKVTRIIAVIGAALTIIGIALVFIGKM